MFSEKPELRKGSRVAVIRGEETVEQMGTILDVTETMRDGPYHGRHCVLVYWLPSDRVRLVGSSYRWETRASIAVARTTRRT